jgi:ATP-dependent Clp protease ATP-binding subunit ClpC
MFQNFTDDANDVLQFANDESQRLNHESVGTEHLLLGLIRVRSGVAAKVFKNLQINRSKIRLDIGNLVGIGSHVSTANDRPLTAPAKLAIDYAIEEARQLNDEFVDTDHILVGLLLEQNGVAAQVLTNHGFQLDELREEILSIVEWNEVDE